MKVQFVAVRSACGVFGRAVGSLEALSIPRVFTEFCDAAWVLLSFVVLKLRDSWSVN